MILLIDLQEARDNITNDDDNLNVVPLLMQNKAPVNDDCTKADVELRPNQVSERKCHLLLTVLIHCV